MSSRQNQRNVTWLHGTLISFLKLACQLKNDIRASFVTFFPLAIDGSGKFTNMGSAVLIMGVAGGALLPLLYTILKDKAIFSNQVSFFVCILPSYSYIFYYAVKGFTKGKIIKPHLMTV